MAEEQKKGLGFQHVAQGTTHSVMVCFIGTDDVIWNLFIACFDPL